MPEARIIDVEQGTPEWFAARAGIPTASEFDCLVRKLKNGNYSAARRTYMLKLAGERLTGQPMPQATGAALRRGHAMEDEARSMYAFLTNLEVKRVGFVRRGNAGCSPDSFVGDEGGLEIKTKEAHLLLQCILEDEVPDEHVAQLQGFLWVTGRKWIDFVAYWPGLPLFVKRVTRDDGYIANLVGEVRKFNTELAEVCRTVRALGGCAINDDPGIEPEPEQEAA